MAEVKLSERLEAACTGVLVAEATGNLDIVTDAVNKLLDAAREAAELARRVEDAPCAVAGQSPGRFYYAGGSASVEHGQRVRLVPEAGQEVGSG